MINTCLTLSSISRGIDCIVGTVSMLLCSESLNKNPSYLVSTQSSQQILQEPSNQSSNSSSSKTVVQAWFFNISFDSSSPPDSLRISSLNVPVNLSHSMHVKSQQRSSKIYLGFFFFLSFEFALNSGCRGEFVGCFWVIWGYGSKMKAWGSVMASWFRYRSRELEKMKWEREREKKCWK